MHARYLLAALCLASVTGLAWLSTTGSQPAELKQWDRVADGIYRTKAMPHSYAVADGEKALLVDATVPPEALKELGVKSVEAVLLTHHHRDTAEYASEFRTQSINVRAPKASAEWLTPENVVKFWKESIPLRTSRTAYFVLPQGVEGIDCTVEDGKGFDFGPWRVTPVATPGHSRDHFAYRMQRAEKNRGPVYLFCGDAFCSPGKMWTPFTTDWDHWTDAGLKPAAESLRVMAKHNPTHLCPAHGAVLDKDVAKALEDTARAVDEAAFMKSFERYSKERLTDAPKYDFLVPKEQIASGGEKPWAKVCDRLWITGNTYVLKSKTGDGIFVLDPWGQRSADQVEKLRKDEKLGPVELAAFSHAHYDHFDGIYVLNGRDRCEVWALDLVAAPLKDPNRIRAPFLDARPIKFTKELKDGDTATWGGYSFKFHHLPGQSWFTSGIETTIDGKRCMFTADNFFHQDQFSGTGGWMGLNRSSPAVYGTSAKKVLDIAPEWILAEHGGPYVFDQEDYRRRVTWGEVAGRAADALCVCGDHRIDWTPHRVTIEPVLQTAKPGDEITVRVTLSESERPDSGATVTLRGRELFADQTIQFPAGGRQARDVKLKIAATAPAGRAVFWVHSTTRTGPEPVDSHFAVDLKGN
jgi:glyoxylase-like metal-dependent hydrolase (beta-lactamase superfamily II)